MRDRDVRRALLAHLGEVHAGDSNTRVVEEMGVWSGSARIDVAVINGELTGFELKSARDTLERLRSQAEVYNLVFDRVCLVATDKHLRKASELIPSWWGTYSVAEDISGQTVLRRRRTGKLNPGRDPLVLAQLLWREEALSLLEKHQLANGWRSKTAKALHMRLAEKLPICALGEGVRSALKARIGWLGQVGSNPLDMAIDANPNPCL